MFYTHRCTCCTQIETTQKTLNLTVVSVNDQPEADNIAVTTREDTPLELSIALFENGYTDIEETEMQSVVIKNNGVNVGLFLDDQEVELNQEIPRSQISNLKIYPGSNFSGTDKIRFTL